MGRALFRSALASGQGRQREGGWCAAEALPLSMVDGHNLPRDAESLIRNRPLRRSAPGPWSRSSRIPPALRASSTSSRSSGRCGMLDDETTGRPRPLPDPGHDAVPVALRRHRAAEAGSPLCHRGPMSQSIVIPPWPGGADRRRRTGSDRHDDPALDDGRLAGGPAVVPCGRGRADGARPTAPAQSLDHGGRDAATPGASPGSRRRTADSRHPTAISPRPTGPSARTTSHTT